ncbi:Protease inhibitor/seed storage/LTP family [Musa troglodytarum]|uniref:Protease inhibitor/seed storage/LTP family n=1 Tax=Musa troglodytarum TaxID=320322 RepID=A0A9E7GPD1_9LILI|nr:Protease inhibitor/seed storage/LTP family [Musa troglodytarum]
MRSFARNGLQQGSAKRTHCTWLEAMRSLEIAARAAWPVTSKPSVHAVQWKGQQRNQLAVAASHGCPGELTLLLLLSLLGSGRADFASDRAECGNQVIGLATCLAYVQGHAEDPSPDCCSGLKQVVAKSFRCLCVLIKDRNEPNLSFRFNFTRALLLSPKCDVTANLSDCPRLLNLAPNSAEAKFFEQFGMDIKATAAGAGAGNGFA